MIALLGKLLVLVGCTAIGLDQGLNLHRRRDCLRDFRRLLSSVARELTFSMRPLTALLEHCRRESGSSVGTFLSACQVHFKISGEVSWAESWWAALENTPLPLRESDRRLLGEAGDILGRYDGESQSKALEALLARLNEAIAEADGEAKRLFRVYLALGVTVGLFAAILL